MEAAALVVFMPSAWAKNVFHYGFVPYGKAIALFSLDGLIGKGELVGESA